MMADKLFTKRLRDLTDEAIRESLAEISVEFEKRFGPAAWNTRATQPLSLTVDEERAAVVDWLRTKADHRAGNTFEQLAVRIENGEHLDRLQSLSGEQIAENVNCSGDIDRSGLAQEVES